MFNPLGKIKNLLKEIPSVLVLYRSFKDYHREIIVLGLMGFVSGLLEGIGVNALIPLFSFVTGGDGGTDLISQAIKKLFVYLHLEFSVQWLLIFILCLFLLRTLVLFAFYYVKIKISAEYEQKTRSRLLEKTIGARWPHLLKERVGTLNTLLITHTEWSANALLALSSTLMAASVLLVYVFVALNISAPVTIFAFLVGVVSIVIMRPLFLKTAAIGKKNARATEDVAHFVNQNVSGMKTIKYMGVAEPLQQVGEDYFAELKLYKIKVYLYKNFAPQIVQLAGIVFICVLFAISYRYQYLTFGALVAVIYLIQRIFVYVQQLQGYIHQMSELTPYVEEVLEYDKKLESQVELDSGDKPFSFADKLSFNSVSFGYEQRPAILNSVSFSVNKGETVAIIGPSGAGKTTIVDLVLRLFRPQSGSITLDDVPAEEIKLRDWRSKIGYMSQDMFLINGTIFENIGFYDNSVTKQDAEVAATQAGIFDFIASAELGFDTPIGERGVQLSVGQRQRIVIARILARKPQLLILDEATSALDTESELHIQNVLHNLKGSVTVLLIAHRISTVKNADKIIVLEKGKIIESGSPQTLLKDSNSYFYKVQNT